jgi:hypothetical protein
VLELVARGQSEDGDLFELRARRSYHKWSIALICQNGWKYQFHRHAPHRDPRTKHMVGSHHVQITGPARYASRASRPDLEGLSIDLALREFFDELNIVRTQPYRHADTQLVLPIGEDTG